MTTNIKLISAIGTREANALADIGIYTSAQLLARGATSSGRMRVADESRLSDEQIKAWVHIADLLRLDKVGTRLATLLCAAGVMTVPKLAYQTARGLYEKLLATNADNIYMKRLPDLQDLEGIISAAKHEPKIVRH